MHRLGSNGHAVKTGVVHLGLGAFHRAHQACVFDQLIQQGDDRWGVFGVAMHNPATLQALEAQGWQYAVQVASATGSHWHTIHAIRAGCVAALQRPKVIDQLACPASRWVTLTVTEKGYAAPLAQLLIEGLHARAVQLGDTPAARLTIASCDNVSQNGDHVRALILQASLASELSAGLHAWIERHCYFPNSMVDRIVPQSSPAFLQAARKDLGQEDKIALATEAFWEWVIEDQLADPADADILRSAGVQVVANVRPFEEAKLRMLNASHSALACMGAVMGLDTIADCIAQPALRTFAHQLMTRDVAPFVDRPQVEAYRDALLERFANPALQHRVLQICSDNSLKLPLRWLPTYMAHRQHRKLPQHLAFATACWIRFLQGSDENGKVYNWSDPQAHPLQAQVLQHAGDDRLCAASLLRIPSIWGTQAGHDDVWVHTVGQYLTRIKTLGLMTALTQHLESQP